MKRKSLLFLFLFFFLPVSLLGQLPRMLPYHGAFTDTLGNPKADGTYTFTFRLYDVSSGGSALWTEIKDLQIKRGLFQTYLGDTSPFGAAITFDRQYWLGVKPGADPELSPRVALLPVANSLYALNSDTSRFARGIADNTITTTKIVDGQVTGAKIAAGAITATQLANGSVNAAKIADEPGVNYVESSGTGFISTNSASCQVASVTINAPTAGYVMVTASTGVYIAVTTAGENLVRVKVSSTANDVNEAAGVQMVRLQAGVGTGNFMVPSGPSRIFPVSAGANTFYLNMWHQVVSGTSQYDTYTLTAQFFPTRY